MLWGRKQTEDSLLQEGEEDGEELSSLPWIDTPTQITQWMGHYLIEAHLRCLFGYPVILYNSRIEASRPTGLVFT